MPFTVIARRAAAAAVATLTILVLGACSVEPDPPEGVAAAFIEAIAKGDSETATKLMYIPEQDREDPDKAQSYNHKLQQMGDGAKEKIDRMGGIKSIAASQVTNHEPDDKGVERATVILEITTNDGNVTNQRVRLIKSGNEWKVFNH